MSKEDKGEWIPLDIYDLPKWMAIDLMQGHSIYKVKITGKKRPVKTYVTDHLVWYYLALEIKVTHWFKPNN